jgi:hypothetical protein
MGVRPIWGTGLDIVRREGPFAFYKGWLATLAGIAPFVGFKVTFVDFFRPYVIPDSTHPMFASLTMCLGAAAGAFAATLTYPQDLIRRRM